MKPSSQSRIFISYAHGGNGLKWKAALLRALHVFEQHHLLDVWQDGRIREGAIWADDIASAMNNAQLAVVLLSKEALESQFILNTEFPCLKERQQRDKLPVFPVICEPCNWWDHDWLRATQAPNGANPLLELSETAQDQVFRKLATAIAEELSRLALAEDSTLRVPQPASGETKTYLDKFPLTRGPGLREEQLIGREQELAILDLAFAQPHTAIVSLVAWGGVGKTMLVQHWLQRLHREGWFGALRVYAWSFYSQGTKEDRQTSEDTFLAHALEWFGVQCEPTLSPWDKGRLLAAAVARERTLLMLDGIEPLQYPPGPMGGQLRAPGVRSLLKQLARMAVGINSHPSTLNQALCLVTTREPLTDLADFQRREGSPWGSVLRVDLSNLTEEAGAALLHNAGANRAGAAEIKPDDTELLAASREVDGHALTVNLLGRFLARAYGGDIRRRDLVKFEEADRKEQGGTTFKMLAAFENWFAKSGEFGARQLAILRILGLFDRPADAGCIAALRKAPAIAGLTDPLFTSRPDASAGQEDAQPLLDEDWNTAASFLADFGLALVQFDDGERVIDGHPLVREYFSSRQFTANRDAWVSAHSRLFGHLTAFAEFRPTTLAGLGPLYQAVFHGCLAGRYREACIDTFYVRVRREQEFYSWRKVGCFGPDLCAISCFFAKPWFDVAKELTSEWQSWLMNEAGFCLRAMGRFSEAVTLFRTSTAICRQDGDWTEVAQRGGNLSELELTLGESADAIRDAQDAIEAADQSESVFHRIVRRTTLADALHQVGRTSDALMIFGTAEELQTLAYPECPLLPSLRGFQYCDLLLYPMERRAWVIWNRFGRRKLDFPQALESTAFAHIPNETLVKIERRATQCLEWATKHNRLLDVALDQLTLDRIALYRALNDPQCFVRSDSNGGGQGLITAFRRAGQNDELPRCLLTQSWWSLLIGDLEGARADLDEAWDIAERGPMRLHMADIHLYRARLFFREKPYPWKSPQDDLTAAEKLINACGYHRRDEELADAKRAILGK